MTLCEYSLELAEEEAKKRLSEALMKLTIEICDEMMETAEEYEPEATL